MIRLLHVTKTYPRTGDAVSDVSLYLHKSEFCFLTGHSGAGKSTIMRLIHMAERPTSGEVRVSGYSSARIRPREIALLRRKIGFCFRISACSRTERQQRTWHLHWRSPVRGRR